MDDIKPKTVLFYAINTPGHVNILLALADKIKSDHGYNTVFLLIGPTFETSIENHGHKLIILEEENVKEEYEMSEDDEMADVKEKPVKRKIKLSGFLKYEYLLRSQLKDFEQDPLDRMGNLMSSFKNLLQSELIDNHENLSAAIKSIDPDLVIADVFLVPPSIQNLTNIPWVKLCSANPLQLTKANPEFGVKPPGMVGFKLLDKARRKKLREENPAEWEEMVESWRSASKRMEEAFKARATTPLEDFFEKHGCPLPSGILSQESPHLNLYLFPKEIDYDQDDDLFQYPSRCFRCDSMIRKPMGPKNLEVSQFWANKLNEAMVGKKEMIFFSLGSLASGKVKLMKKYINIFKKDPNRLYVVSKGVNGDKYELDPNNMIGGNYIPQTLFLEQANLAIVHGGNNSVFECLYFGIPMIVLPVFGDQTDNAQRIEDMGLGKRLPVFDCNEESLLKAIDEILSNKAMIERVQSVGKQMRARDTATKVSLILQKLLEDKHLDENTIDLFRNRNGDEMKS